MCLMPTPKQSLDLPPWGWGLKHITMQRVSTITSWCSIRKRGLGASGRGCWCVSPHLPVWQHIPHTYYTVGRHGVDIYSWLNLSYQSRNVHDSGLIACWTQAVYLSWFGDKLTRLSLLSKGQFYMLWVMISEGRFSFSAVRGRGWPSQVVQARSLLHLQFPSQELPSLCYSQWPLTSLEGEGDEGLAEFLSF